MSHGLVRQSIISVDQQLTHPEGPTIVEQCMWLNLQAKRQRASSWKVRFKLPTNASVSDLPIHHKRKPKTMLQATRNKTKCNIAHCPFAHTMSDRNTEREQEQQEKGDDSLHSLSGFKVLMHLQQLLGRHAQRDRAFLSSSIYVFSSICHSL